MVDPSIEVSGQLLLPLKSSINQGQVNTWLEPLRLDEVVATGWYPLAPVLVALHGIASDWNGAVTLMSAGMIVTRQLPVPPEYQQLPFIDQMRGIDLLYQSMHRYGDVGNITVEWCGNRCIIVRTAIPYPDDILYGMLWQKAREHLGRFDLTFLSRRDEGDESTAYHLRWYRDMTGVTDQDDDDQNEDMA